MKRNFISYVITHESYNDFLYNCFVNKDLE